MEQKALWTTLGYVQMTTSAGGMALALAWGFEGGSSHRLLAHRCTQLSLQCEDQPRSLGYGHRPVSPGCELTAGWWQAVCLAVPHVTASAGEARTARGVTALHPTCQPRSSGLCSAGKACTGTPGGHQPWGNLPLGGWLVSSAPTETED